MVRNNLEYNNKILEKISEISTLVNEKVEEISHYSGVHYGIAGLVLFQYYEYLFEGKSSTLDKLLGNLGKCISNLNREDYPTNFVYRDFGEIGLLLLFLIERKVIVFEDVKDLFIDFDSLLDKYLDKKLEENNLDAVTGALLCGNYFIERLKSEPLEINRKNIKKSLNKVLEKIEKTFYYFDEYSVYWVFNALDKDEVLLGKLHGVSGVVSFLMKAYQEFRQDKFWFALIRKGINFMILCHSKRLSSISIYDVRVSKNRRQVGNLAYGDLPIGYTLVEASLFFKDKNLNKKAKEILSSFLSISAEENDLIRDANLVYGTAGVATVFNDLYIKTGDLLYKQCFEKWLNYSLSYATHKNDLAGYKIYWNANHSWTNYCFSQGIAGIGLMLISNYTQDTAYLKFLHY